MQPLIRVRIASTALALVAGACSSTAPGTAVAPSPAPECAPPLSAEDLDGGFLSGVGVAPTSGTIIEAVLATGGGEPRMTGRTILFDGAFSGPLPVTVKGGAMIAVEAATPIVDAEACAGSVRIGAASDLLGGNSKGEAFAGAQLGRITVGGGSMFCTALSAGLETFAVECPSIGIRIGDQASTGILWLRFRTAGEPTIAASMPSWIDDLTGLVPATETAAPGPPTSGTVSLDGEPFDIQPVGDLDAVVIEPQIGGTKIGYRAGFTFLEGDAYSSLTIGIPDYDGPGMHATGVLVSYSRTVLVEGVLTTSATFSGADCGVEISDDERQGSTSCTLTAEAPASGTVAVTAEWSVPTVRRSVGSSVRVQWAIGWAYVSSGQATVLASVNTMLDPSILRAAEVLVGRPGTFDLLRIDIRGFTGDGTYTGESVDPSLQDVVNDSLNLRMNLDPNDGIPAPNGEPWTPLFGACTATVGDDGRSGSIRCPGVAGYQDEPTGGSTTLLATWAPA